MLFIKNTTKLACLMDDITLMFKSASVVFVQ